MRPASASTGYASSREMLINYIRNLPSKELKKLLAPVKDGLLTENTVLHMNTVNFSVDHVVVPITVKELLEELGPVWKKWVHTMDNEINEHLEFFASHRQIDHDIADYQILEYIKDMDKYQKRSMLNLVREGILTDECFIHVSPADGPERVQIQMTRVVDTLIEAERKFVAENELRPFMLKIAFAKHYSSACFDKLHKADLDVRSLSAARFTMPVWYTVMFLTMTLGTFVSQVWSQITNFEGLQENLNLTMGTILLVVSSLAIGFLLYLTIYMIGFLCCCENNLASQGLVTRDLNYGMIYAHFCELNRIEARIYATKIIQFALVWYSMVLSIFAHQNDLNIYPALITVLTNGFGLMLFARIAQFFRTCRRTRQGTAIAAR